MSFWNENPLASRKWKPRQPSPELRARIFGLQPRPEAGIAFGLRDFSRWIVPALGCFLLVMASVSDHFPTHSSLRASATNFVLADLSNENGTITLPDSTGHSGINAFPAKLEWKVGARPAAGAVESARFLLSSYTNKLIQ